MGKHIYTYTNPPSERDIGLACQVLEEGGVLAYPTEINWAFGCDPFNQIALEKMLRLKPDHPKTKPFSFICDSISMASNIAVIDSHAYCWLRQFFPGPFTVILLCNRSLPRKIKENRSTVGIRIPDHQFLLELVKRYKKPLVTTSIPSISVQVDDQGEVKTITRPPRFGYEVFDNFGHQIDLLLDLGEELSAQETTIIDLTGDGPIVIRYGAGNDPGSDLKNLPHYEKR